jgi:NAD(P)-dependent dehydrogenase (short-subunit alcohol dehydrogenase family)
LGANVHISVRNQAKADDTITEILQYVNNHAPDMASEAKERIFAHYVEMSDFASVRAFCQEFKQPIDILVNNAGLQSKEKQTTKDGYELTWQVNYLCSTFLTTRLLLPRLQQAGSEKQRRSKVINISSGMHRMVKNLELGDINFDKRPYGFVEGKT